MTFRGLTWDHPRGRQALEAAATLSVRRGGADVRWEARTLEQFESQPLADVVDSYDLVVLDHPHLGEAIREGALHPLDDFLPPELIADLSANSVGPSLECYRMDGRVWGVPLDAATQVAVSLTGRLESVPTTWSDVVELCSREPVALSLSGPHALLTFASLCAALGEAVGTTDDEFVSSATADAALQLLREIAGRAPKGCETQNPIHMLDRMATVGDISYVPLIYGYVNYSMPSLQFSDAPVHVAGGPRGSIVGGTGLAVTRRCVVDEQLVAHIAWLLSSDMQTRFIPQHEGQPSRREAWRDRVVDVKAHGFYSGTLATIEASTVRPRYDGFVPFQSKASEIVRTAVLTSVRTGSFIDRLQDAYAASLPTRRRVA